MEFSEHIAHIVPDWLQTFMDDIVLPCVTPLGFIGQIGYRYWTPDDTKNPSCSWLIAAYPVPNELRGSHKNDGVTYVSGFRFNVTSLLDAFSGIEELVWNSPTVYVGNMDGPELSLRGMYGARPLWLRFFHIPPTDEKAGFAVNPQTSEVKELLS